MKARCCTLRDISTRSPDCGRRQWTFLRSALVLLNIIAGPAGAADYLLGPSDKVRIKAYEWRAARDELFEWDALNDEFTVGAAGTLSLPFVGDVRVVGTTTRDLAETIADRLRSEMGLRQRPDTSVEVVQFRPFYIVGHVDHPGEYPYRPGLTVLQAMTIAGGLPKVNDGLVRLGREAISTRGELQVLGAQAAYLRAHRARLEAELKQSDAFDLHATHPANASAELAMRQEAAIFEIRREAFLTQTRALEQLKDFLEKEVLSLEGQRQVEETEAKLVKKELANVVLLADKGLATAPRRLELERTVAQLDGEQLRVETSLLRAKQEISRTEISMLELKHKRANDVAIELRETQAKLEELDRKSETSVELLDESEVTATQLLARHARSGKMQPVYTIVRQKGEKALELDASESTAVEPGDTVKVEVPLRDMPPVSDASPGLTDSPVAGAPSLQPAVSANPQ